MVFSVNRTWYPAQRSHLPHHQRYRYFLVCRCAVAIAIPINQRCSQFTFRSLNFAIQIRGRKSWKRERRWINDGEWLDGVADYPRDVVTWLEGVFANWVAYTSHSGISISPIGSMIFTPLSYRDADMKWEGPLVAHTLFGLWEAVSMMPIVWWVCRERKLAIKATRNTTLSSNSLLQGWIRIKFEYLSLNPEVP